jgi:hypothetical protein
VAFVSAGRNAGLAGFNEVFESGGANADGFSDFDDTQVALSDSFV